MKSLPLPSFLAYLDLVCCAMGAGLLLFLIAVSATPIPKRSARESQMLAVRCVWVEGPKLEVGIEMRGPGSADWVHSRGTGQIGFVARADPRSGAEAWIILVDPAEGIWEFRPYLRDHPQAGSEVKVRLEVYGQTVLTPNEPDKIQSLSETGGHGTSVKVRVTAWSPLQAGLLQVDRADTILPTRRPPPDERAARRPNRIPGRTLSFRA